MDSKDFCDFQKPLNANPTAGGDFQGWPVYNEALQILENQHIKLVDPASQKAFDKEWNGKFDGSGVLDNADCTDKAVETMVKSLGERFDHYLDPSLMERIKAAEDNEHRGIGVYLDERDPAHGNAPVFGDVFEGAPAWNAGIRPGDHLLSVNGQSVIGKSVDQASKLLAAAPGDLTLGIQSEQGDKTVHVKPADYTVEPVITKDLGNGVAYIKLRDFTSDDSPPEMKAALTEANKGKAVVLDLRKNPGGRDDYAEEIGQMMLPDGKFTEELTRVGSAMTTDSTIFDHSAMINCHSDDKSKPTCKTENRKHNLILGEDKPLVILVDNDTYSASEITAGALQANRKNTEVVGEPSKGKGEGQHFAELPDDRGLLVTTFDFRPGGRDINWVGVVPDVEVKGSFKGGQDSQLDVARSEALKLVAKEQALLKEKEDLSEQHHKQFENSK